MNKYIGRSKRTGRLLFGRLLKSVDNSAWYIIPEGEVFTTITNYEVDSGKISLVNIDVSDEVAQILREGIEYIKARASVKYDELTCGAHNSASRTTEARELANKAELCYNLLKLIQD